MRGWRDDLQWTVGFRKNRLCHLALSLAEADVQHGPYRRNEKRAPIHRRETRRRPHFNLFHRKLLARSRRTNRLVILFLHWGLAEFGKELV